MKSFAIAACMWLSLASVAFAQGSDVPARFVGGFAQSAFGNVTSQSFGAEAGVRLTPAVEIFVEGGHTVDAAPASMGQAAQLVTAQIEMTAPNASYTVKQPVDFVDAGLRYNIDIQSKLTPYVLAGLGVGMVKANATFSVNGTDVTSNLAQYGVALGSDLSGTTSKLMAVGGAGARYSLTRTVFADLEFRYNRVFITGRNIPFSRVGLGLGFRF